MKKNAIFITGCSRGIGYELTNILLDKKFFILSIGRTMPNLTSNFQSKISHFECDLSRNNYYDNLVNWIESIKNDFNFVGFVHSAGIGDTTNLLKTPNKKIVDQINVNLLSGILLSKAILPYLNQSKSRIFFIGSRSRRFPFLGGSTYCASKSGLYALTDCLALEVKKLCWNIGITIFEFGTVATGFANLPVSKKQISPFSAAEFMAKIFLNPLSEYDTRVIEIVPSVVKTNNE